MRVPNYFNIYRILLGEYYYKYDYRTSHNYYFSMTNLSLLFKKLNFTIHKQIGFNEYDFNHLLAYIKNRKRVGKKYKRFFVKKDINFLKKNIEDNFASTSLIYVLSNKRK